MTTSICTNFTKDLQDSLQQGNTKRALNIISDIKNYEEVKNGSWDTIPIVTEYLTTENKNNNLQVFECCKNLLNIIAKESNPEEVVLQFISELEEARDDTNFVCLLGPLQQVLFRILNRRENSLAWSFNAIQTYLNKCEIPDYSNLLGKEKLLLDSNDQTIRILSLYSEIVPFYDPFLNELLECKAVVTKFLVQLLGQPLGSLDMEEFDGIKSKARIFAENLVAKILRTTSDPFLLLELRFEVKNNELTSPGSLGLAVLFYLIYSEEVHIDKIPKVYNPIYLFQSTLHLVSALLENDQTVIIEKGLKLSESICKHIKNLSLPYLLLDSNDHSKFCKIISNVIVFNSIEYFRKKALSIFGTYLKSFKVRGFYLLVYNLMSILTHSGLIGFVISVYKDLLAREILKNEVSLSVYFRGQKLFALLKKFCYLPQKEETDLIEYSDQIISTLNLLRFIIIRDKNNVTFIWYYVEVLNDSYLERLRKGIDLSRAHYELKIRELHEDKSEGDKQDSETEMSIIVGSKNLPKMSKNEKLQVLSASLTAFDVIDSLLSRLIECIECRRVNVDCI